MIARLPHADPQTRGPLLGSNVSTVGGLPRAFVQAREWNCAAIQVYTTPSRRWEIGVLESERRELWFAERAASPVQAVIAHVPFIVNTASPDTHAWQRSLDRLVQEVERAEELAVAAVVLHPGSGGDTPRDKALARSACAIRSAIDATAGSPVRILVENMAGQGTTLCGCFEELRDLLAMIDRPDRSGVCFDTAHAFIAGYTLVGYTGYREVIDELDHLVGLDRVMAIHLNDSLSVHGSRHDRHAAVGHGAMGLAVFHALVRDPRFAGVPMVLEVPDRDGQSFPALEVLRELEARELPLEDDVAQPVQLGLVDAAREAA